MYMKNIVYSLILVMCSSTSNSIIAQEAAQAGPAADEAIHQQLREFREEMLGAIAKKDKDRLLSLMADDVVITVQDGSKLVAVRKLDGVTDYLDRLLTGSAAGVKDLQVDVKVDEKTLLYGNNSLGIAFGTSNDRYVLQEGASFELATRWTATLVNQDGKWKLASLHVSSNLFDNPIVTTQRATLKYALGVAGGIGLILGLILGKLTRKA